jgi:hypothetical protein
MRRRRPLAALAAICLAALGMLALTTREAHPDVAYSYVPLTVAPSCGAVSQTAGYQVQLTGSGLTPGTNTVSVGNSSLSTAGRTAVTTVTVASDGTLNATVTLPAVSSPNLVSVEVGARLRIGYGYFSVPCPTIAVQPTCGPADDGTGAHYALTITGTGFGPPPSAPGAAGSTQTYPLGGSYLPVHIELDGTEVPGSPAKVLPDGTIDVLVTPARVKPGVHTFHAYQTTGDYANESLIVVFRDATTTFTVPCATTTTTPTTTATPTTQTTATTAPTTAPTTHAATTATVTTVTTATTTTPRGPLTLAISPTCLESGAAGTSRVQLTGGGFAPGALQVLVDGKVATQASAGGGGGFTAEVEVAAGSSDHAIEARQGSRTADATLHVPCTSHPRLQVSPAIGPPGTVTQASGTGFPPNVRVRLSWTVGVGSSTVRTDARGAFHASVLIFPQDETGARALRAQPVAQGAFGGVKAAFLCVPGSEQPRSFSWRR